MCFGRTKYDVFMPGLLLVYFGAALVMDTAAPAPALNNASSHPIVISLAPSSLSNSTANSSNPPPNPWIRETSAGSTISLSNYGSAGLFDPYAGQADIGIVFARARAEAVRREPSSSVPRILDYSEENAFLYVRLLSSEMTWSIWSAALEQISYFNRNWDDVTFYVRILQPSGPGPGSVNRVVANGQLRVRWWSLGRGSWIVSQLWAQHDTRFWDFLKPVSLLYAVMPQKRWSCVQTPISISCINSWLLLVPTHLKRSGTVSMLQAASSTEMVIPGRSGILIVRRSIVPRGCLDCMAWHWTCEGLITQYTLSWCSKGI